MSGSQLSESSGFAFTTFGAVTPIESVNNKTIKRVEIPADRAADFARAAAYFDGQPNTEKLAFELATDADAELFRSQVTQWAADHKRSAGLPKHVKAHTRDVAEKTDAATGKVTPAHTVDVPDNGIPAHWNVGKHVAFRIGKVRKDDSPKNGPVTVAKLVAEYGADAVSETAREVIASRNATARDGRS